VSEFSVEQQEVWQILFEKLIPQVEKFACKDFLEGFKLLNMSPEKIPTLEALNEIITRRTGWKTVRTSVRYTQAGAWYPHFARKEFLITNFIRSKNELDFTPEPDMFHDIFGHMAFMTLPHYTDLQEMFAPAFLKATPEEQEDIKRLAWFSTEFGLIMEDGEMKVFGAGLLSSHGEIQNVMLGKVPLLPFTIENVLNRDKAIWNFNDQLFVIESIDALKKELATFFNPILKRKELVVGQ